MSIAAENEFLAKPETLLRVPVGLASPLWGLFAGAAVSGATWWWMTQWARTESLEAMRGAGRDAETAIAPETASFAPLAEAGEAPIDPPVEAAEAIAEAPPETLAEALVEVVDVAEPVGGESAPVSPVLAVLEPAPKPKKKSAEPKDS